MSYAIAKDVSVANFFTNLKLLRLRKHLESNIGINRLEHIREINQALR